VVLSAPANLPNGTPVTVSLVTPVGTDELPDDEDVSPEAISRRLALVERVRPWMTEEELAEWERVRGKDKAFQLSQWEKWTKEVKAVE
jgi:hypothetical protein